MAQAKQALVALLSLFISQSPVTVDLGPLLDKHKGSWSALRVQGLQQRLQ